MSESTVRLPPGQVVGSGRGHHARGPRRRGGIAPSPWWALLFIGPTLIGLLAFYIYPTVRTLWISLTESGPFGGEQFVGLDNYVALFHDEKFPLALRNTFVYAFIQLLGIPLAAVIAALLNTPGLRGKGFYRTLYFLPVVTLLPVVGLTWRLIFNGDYGILNQFLAVFGVSGRSWLTDSSTALVAIALVGIWIGLGTNIVIFMAGLQSIPETTYEAAHLDGAGPVQTFCWITLPLLSPTIFLVSVLSLIGSMQVFDLIFVMGAIETNPAAADLKSMVFLFFQSGFREYHYGYAAAIGFVLMAIILILTLIQFRLQKRLVHYE